MADTVSREQRSWNMSRIRGKNTKPELLVRRLIHAAGYRYRLHGRAAGATLPGKPDLVFAGRRKVIFVNGCFWYSHTCKTGQTAPKTNAAFWEAKRTRTRQRDAAQAAALAELGWDVLVVWECELKDISRAGTAPRRFPGKPGPARGCPQGLSQSRPRECFHGRAHGSGVHVTIGVGSYNKRVPHWRSAMTDSLPEPTDLEVPAPDFQEQQEPAVDDEAELDAELPSAVPLEANEADVLENSRTVPVDEEYPHG